VLATDNGSPVTQYKVFVKEIDTGSFTLESVDCDGSTSLVIATKECLINISTLLALPYSVDGGDSIYAKVSAVNFYGEFARSTEGNGAYYTRVPDSPVNVAEDISVRTSTTDGLTWEDGVNNGGVPIIDYRINIREQGTQDYNMHASGVTDKSFTLTGLSLGTTYEITIET
jgi:hypothetical protein